MGVVAAIDFFSVKHGQPSHRHKRGTAIGPYQYSTVPAAAVYNNIVRISNSCGL
jgi:hypothetical protein